MNTTTATTKVPESKVVLNLREISEAEIRRDGREYNAQVWDKKISSYAAYKDVKFYIADKGTAGYDYDRYFVVYTLESGLRLFNTVSYSSCLTNRGFCFVTISTEGEVTRRLFNHGGNFGYAENSPANRKVLAERSKNLGAIWTNLF